jgi:hypothetical protein
MRSKTRSDWDLERLTIDELEQHLSELREERKLTEAPPPHIKTKKAQNEWRTDIEPGVIAIDRDIALVTAEIERRSAVGR